MRFEIINKETNLAWTISDGPALVFMGSNASSMPVVYRVDAPEQFRPELDERGRAILEGLLRMGIRGMGILGS